MHILPTDIFVEVLDEEGMPAGEGKPGEITVTGGRNPYMPLLRYRTGDYGRINFSECSCGDPMPFISGLTARKHVIFEKPSGGRVNPIDISRIMKGYPVIMHQFIQKKALSSILHLSLYAPLYPRDRERLKDEIDELFGGGMKLTIKKNLKPEKEKIIPYIRE
jgi:phenylacetate-CoA ligase